MSVAETLGQMNRRRIAKQKSIFNGVSGCDVKEMALTHTPTPWRICGVGVNVQNSIVGIKRPSDGCIGSGYILRIDVGGTNHEANAEFIVRACNAHDALVEVLGEIIDLMTLEAWESLPAWLQEKVLTAYKQAKGE